MAKNRPDATPADATAADTPATPEVPNDENTSVVTENSPVEKAKKLPYRNDADDKLTEFPVDWDPSKHLALQTWDFDNPAPLFDWRAEQAEKKAESWRQKAEEARTLGSPEQRKAANRLRKITDELESLKETLGGTSVNLEEILQQIAARCTVEDE